MPREIKFRVWYPHEGIGPAYLYPDTESKRLGHVKYGDVLPPRAIKMGSKEPIIHGPGAYSDSLVVEMTLDGAAILLGGKAQEGVVLEQYTGLKDFKGREIYEGDIVASQSIATYIGTVRWPDLTAQWIWFHPQWTPALHLLVLGSSSYNVVGNIHENADLLKTQP